METATDLSTHDLSTHDLSTAELLQQVGDGLSVLAERGVSFRSPGDLAAVLDAGPGLRALVDSVVCTAAAEVDRWSLSKDFGYFTVAQMVGDRTGEDPKQTRADVRLGNWVDDFDEFAAAWASKQLLTSHLELIRRGVDNSRTHETLVRDQALFIEEAADCDDFVDFERACQYWMVANDPDGAEPKEQVASNKFKIRKQPDGSVKGSFHLDPLLGHAVKTAVEHEETETVPGRQRQRRNCRRV